MIEIVMIVPGNRQGDKYHEEEQAAGQDFPAERSFI